MGRELPATDSSSILRGARVTIVHMPETDDPLKQRGLGHRLIPMTGRDPQEPHRSATPLELLFDLTFVVAFSQASSELAHLLAEGNLASGLVAFAFSMFAICWAWINFSWFASAYDTDDWFYRITTMVQMIGVLVLALGLSAVFRSIDDGEHLDNGIVVAAQLIGRVKRPTLVLSSRGDAENKDDRAIRLFSFDRKARPQLV
jgi:hypothetical protein